MKCYYPGYYPEFHCIAGRCPDSCCKEWSVTVDDEAAAYYRSLPGALGDRLRQVLKDEDGITVMEIENRRCPMWRQDGLCRIQAELGEESLCQTCRDFPRITHDYGNFREHMLELSCPEAARILLSAPRTGPICREIEGSEEADYDEDAMQVLLRTRQKALDLLYDPQFTVPQALGLLLLYSCQAQGELDGDNAAPFDPSAALATVREFAKPGDREAFLDIYRSLEILTPEWKDILSDPWPSSWQEAYRAIAAYFVERYWLQAVSDYDLYCRVKFILASCAMIRLAGGDLVRAAQLYAKEIENNYDNVEALLDAAYGSPALTDDKLLGLLTIS